MKLKATLMAIAISTLLCSPLAAQQSNQKPTQKPAPTAQDKPETKPDVAKPAAAKPDVALDPKEAEDLADYYRRMREMEAQARQAQAFLASYEAVANGYWARYYRAFANHAKDGVRIDTHTLKGDESGFFKIPPKAQDK